jgi:hypothetical protein
MFFRILSDEEIRIRNIFNLVYFIVVTSIILYLIYSKKKLLESFVDDQFFTTYLKQNTKSGEDLIKFCKVIRNLDNQTEGTRMLKKINNSVLKKGEAEIKKLLNEIHTLQDKDERKQTENKNYYKYKTHVAAGKQRKLVNAVKQRLTEDTNVNVKLM